MTSTTPGQSADASTQPWPFGPPPTPPDGDAEAYTDEFVDTISSLRALLGTFAHAAPTTAELLALRGDLERWTSALRHRRTDPTDAPYGQVHRSPSHSFGHLPTLAVRSEGDGDLVADVEFDLWHRGAGPAVHGGQVANLMDEVMARASLAAGVIARTAYLNLTFHAVTPMERPLEAKVRTVRTEGRKRFLEGMLLDGDQPTVTAEGLFIEVATYPPPGMAP